MTLKFSASTHETRERLRPNCTNQIMLICLPSTKNLFTSFSVENININMIGEWRQASVWLGHQAWIILILGFLNLTWCRNAIISCSMSCSFDVEAASELTLVNETDGRREFDGLGLEPGARDRVGFSVAGSLKSIKSEVFEVDAGRTRWANEHGGAGGFNLDKAESDDRLGVNLHFKMSAWYCWGTGIAMRRWFSSKSSSYFSWSSRSLCSAIRLLSTAANRSCRKEGKTSNILRRSQLLLLKNEVVCVWEREREREWESVHVCVHVHRCVCVCVRKRTSVWQHIEKNSTKWPLWRPHALGGYPKQPFNICAILIYVLPWVTKTCKTHAHV